MWFHYHQNNTGGSFLSYEDKLVEDVLIEAATKEEANAKFPFKLCFGGVDACGCCPCCGHRWEEPWEGTEEPTIYDEPYVSHRSYSKLAYVLVMPEDSPDVWFPVSK
jgi:hypothetical protein